MLLLIYMQMRVYFLKFLIRVFFSSSVLVGDGSSTPVSKVGHSTLSPSNPYGTLVLCNVWNTLQIIKNLIAFCRFNRENGYSVEFDSYGVSVNSFKTKQILMRCDSTGYLYHVTTPTP